MAWFLLAGRSEIMAALAKDLRRERHRVLTAADAREALDSFIIYRGIDVAIMENELDVSRCAPHMQAETGQGRSAAEFIAGIARGIGRKTSIVVLGEGQTPNRQVVKMIPPYHTEAIIKRASQIHAQQARINAAEKERQARQPVIQPSIYIICHHPEITELLELTLREYKVRSFLDPRMMLREMQHQCPDLVITMHSTYSAMDRDGFIKSIRTDWPKEAVGILVATVFGGTGTLKKQVKDHTIDDYFVTPFEPQQLRKKIRKIIQARWDAYGQPARHG